MKLPTQKKIIKTEFDEENQQLVEKLSGSVDYNFDKVFSALSGNIDLVNNLKGIVKEFQVTVDSSGIPLIPVRFNSTLTPARPFGAMVIDQTNLTNSTTYPTGAVMVTYTESKGVVTVNHFTGLPANNTFRIKIVFFG
jgi:hypothetical protein